MQDVVPGLGHELTWLLLQFTYWPQPDGFPLPGDAGVLLSLVYRGGLLVQPAGDAALVPRRVMINPMQYPALAAVG
jgi:hypothetical protein